MKIIETSQVLAKIQAFNNRTVDRAVVTMWHEILEPYEMADCLRAVTDYFRENKAWIMPVDITERVREYQKTRIAEFKGDLRLSDSDERKALSSESWREANKRLHHLARNGHLTPAQYDDYQAGRIQLDNITPKELAK